MYSMLMQERSVGAVEGEDGTVGDVLLQKDARYKYCLFMMILLLFSNDLFSLFCLIPSCIYNIPRSGSRFNSQNMSFMSLLQHPHTKLSSFPVIHWSCVLGCEGVMTLDRRKGACGRPPRCCDTGWGSCRSVCGTPQRTRSAKRSRAPPRSSRAGDPRRGGCSVQC